jgi:hypothetical protein
MSVPNLIPVYYSKMKAHAVACLLLELTQQEVDWSGYLLVKHDDCLIEGVQGLPLEQNLLRSALVLLVEGVVVAGLLVVAPVNFLQSTLYQFEIVDAAWAKIRFR